MAITSPPTTLAAVHRPLDSKHFRLAAIRRY
jgi:hypothetical protein